MANRHLDREFALVAIYSNTATSIFIANANFGEKKNLLSPFLAELHSGLELRLAHRVRTRVRRGAGLRVGVLVWKVNPLPQSGFCLNYCRLISNLRNLSLPKSLSASSLCTGDTQKSSSLGTEVNIKTRSIEANFLVFDFQSS